IYKNWIVWWGGAEVLTILFGAAFLKISLVEKSRLSRIVLISVFSSACMAAVSIFDPVTAINVFSVPYHIVILIFCFRSYSKVRAGYYPAKGIIIGWSAHLVATTIQLLYYQGILGPSFFTSWGTVFGNLIQLLFLGTSMFVDKKYHERSAALQLEKNFKDLEHRDAIIQEYSSPKIVSEIGLGLDPRLYKSRWEELAIIFSDMRNFTTFIETSDLATIEETLNSYIGAIIDQTFEHNGEVNKMIGDAVLCIFDDPATCLSACIDMRLALSDLNRKRVASGRPPVKMGTGASHSKVISMNMGRHGKKLDRTVIGDEVNIAARIESLTKELNVDVLVPKKFHDAISDYEWQRPVGSFKLKGKTVTTTLYEIFGHNSPRVRDYKLSTRATFEQVMNLTSPREDTSETRSAYDEALALLNGLMKSCPEHTYLKGKPMDQTIFALCNKIEQERNNLEPGPETRGRGKK
ncbi:MAG: adenylate/guanylate cyclase domain-containing protein, partial [Bdellovibrionia bacterium]